MLEPEAKDWRVDVPGGFVFARTWTPVAVSSPPIVLLHDSLGCVDLWRDFPAALARTSNRMVVAYDRLGFGRSSARTGLPSIDFIGEEARTYFPAIAAALDIDEFSVFGHSVGGAIALAIAAKMKNRCRWAITESAQAFVEQRTVDGIRSAMREFENKEQFGKLIKLHGDKAQWVLDAWTKVWLSPAFAAWNLDPVLKEVECPVLVIHGERDEFGSVEFPNRIANGVQGTARLAILNACGHVPHREQQDAVLELVNNFLASIMKPS